jgi:hypothetical protein
MTARVTLVPSGLNQEGLTVDVSSDRAFTVRTRPRSVTVRYQRRFYRVFRAPRPSSGSATTNATWRSAARRDLGGLLGKTVTVAVTTRAGRLVLRRRVGRPAPTFTPPPRPVTGDAAFTRVRRWFVDSRFANGADSYLHCAGGGMTGRWENRSGPLTRTGTYRVTNVRQETDGSWSITYEVTLTAGGIETYSWAVRADGLAFGGYADSQDAHILTNFRWQQPSGC